jgi:hydroxymethylpyrimidine pyrophosphatase-like HAD family hydrolase
MVKEVEQYITKNYYELLKIANTITKNNQLSQDLLHEVILQLFDKKEIKLKKYEEDQIKYYIVSIMRINWFSKTSPFYYKIRKEFSNYQELTELHNIPEEQDNFEKEIIFTILETSWCELDWFHKSLFEWYMTLGSLKKVSIKTNIPLASVGKYIKEAKNEMKTNVLKKLDKQ